MSFSHYQNVKGSIHIKPIYCSSTGARLESFASVNHQNVTGSILSNPIYCSSRSQLRHLASYHLKAFHCINTSSAVINILFPLSRTYKFIKPFVEKQWRPVLKAWLCAIIAVGCLFCAVPRIGELSALLAAGDLCNLRKKASIVMVLFVIRSVAQYFQQALLWEAALNASYEIRGHVFERVLNRDMSYFEGAGGALAGDISYRITAEANDAADTVGIRAISHHWRKPLRGEVDKRNGRRRSRRNRGAGEIAKFVGSWRHMNQSCEGRVVGINNGKSPVALKYQRQSRCEQKHDLLVRKRALLCEYNVPKIAEIQFPVEGNTIGKTRVRKRGAETTVTNAKSQVVRAELKSEVDLHNVILTKMQIATGEEPQEKQGAYKDQTHMPRVETIVVIGLYQSLVQIRIVNIMINLHNKINIGFDNGYGTFSSFFLIFNFNTN
ncbi:hypothetical protein KI387_035221, partial [Taxus chinensis]